MAAEIIAVTQQKGGVGKSTIAMHLGAAFHEKGRRVLVIDADGQNTLVHWSSSSADSESG
ncbi:ParA family protein, partial [Burkholderia mallei]